MQCRLVLDTEERRERAFKMGIKDPRKRYEIVDMVRGDCLFAATGVTAGAMLRGVRFRGDVIETETVVMRLVTGTVRWIRAEHRPKSESAAAAGLRVSSGHARAHDRRACRKRSH